MDIMIPCFKDEASIERYLTEQKKLSIEERLQALERQAVYSLILHIDYMDREKKRLREGLKKYNLPIPESLRETQEGGKERA